MTQAVLKYTGYVHGLAEDGKLSVEVTFDLSGLGLPQPMFGTADAVITSGRRLDVVDFKYGAGVPVEVNGNAQLLYYALGALLASGLSLESALATFDEIWVHIVQPRAPHADGPIRTAHVSHDEIRAFAKALVEKATATLAPDAPLHAGTWCKFCPAQAFCPEVKRYAIEIAQKDFTVVEPPPVETLPIELVASILTKVDVLEHWVRSLKTRIQSELEAGRPVPGWKLVAKRPQRVWNQTEKLMEWHRAHDTDITAGVDLYDRDLKSPAQVEALIGKKNLPPELYSLVSSGVTLVPEYDRRPAVIKGPTEDFTALPGPAGTQNGGENA